VGYKDQVIPSLRLSVILPWFRKLEEFRQVLPFNAAAWRRSDLEVILVLDEPSEEGPLLELLRTEPEIGWKVIVNDQPHPWRPPCKAINVGLRHARGRFVLVASPESAYVGDVPAAVLDTLEAFPDAVVMGRVGFARLGEVAGLQDLAALFRQRATALVETQSYYGSMAMAREAITAIGGYDETFTTWGGDDDNVRVRLEMAGRPLIGCPELKLLHLSLGDRPTSRNPGFSYDPKEVARRCAPAQPVSSPAEGWGRSFQRLAFATAPASEAPAQPPPARAEILKNLVLAVSLRTCPGCGRRIYHAVAEPPCPQCRGNIPLPRQTSALLSERGRAAKVVAVLQLRDEAAYLPGCLDHLRPYVDGFVALDDGSTDGTRSVLAREPKLLSLLENPPQEPHRWDERENRRRLLTEAARVGADWVLCCDADERFEMAFLRRIRSLAGAFPWHGQVYLYVLFRELWNSPVRFRVDGPWGDKKRARFFSLPKEITFNLDKDFHGEWFPDCMRLDGQGVDDPGCLYHLRSVLRSDRIRRRDRYKGLDPTCEFQEIGYDYLAEEGPGLRLQTIAQGREYDLSTLPEALQF
jgi:hypothetical protein